MSAEAIWVNGAFTDRVSARDRGFALGDGVFDTLTAFGGIPFAGERHLRRLVAQAAAIGIAVDAAIVREGWRAVLEQAQSAQVILRTTVTRGESGRGLWPASAGAPTIVVAASPWSRALFGAPVRLVTSTIRRNPDSPSSRLKTLGYLDHVLAAREAAGQGADDAIFLTPSGAVACSTIANLFAVGGDGVSTPPLADGVQPGILRALVLEAAAELGLRAAERSLARDELLAADAVFLTNSVRFLCPATELDGAALGARGGEALAALSERIAAQVMRECGFDLREG